MPEKKHHISISKTQYLRGMQCLKSLWLHKHSPELRDDSDQKRESSFALGHSVGEIAKSLYPGGVEIEFDAKDFQGMIRRTLDLISSGQKVIYEATFKKDGILVLVDILVKKGDHWEILEVKSSTGVKDYQIIDAGIQWYVVSNFLPVKEAAIVHINNSYTRDGDLEPAKLFHTEFITDQVLALQDEIPVNLRLMENAINGKLPDLNIGGQCNTPFVCDFYGHCWDHIPDSSVFNLYRLRGAQKFDFYHSGVVTLNQIPEDFPLTETQQLQINSVSEGKAIVNSQVIAKFLSKIKFPVSFLDFETMMDAVPRFNSQKPYQQIPFQYSLHILKKSGSLSHKEFIADEFSDPRRSFTENLISNLPKKGTIIAFNMSFEKMILRMMSEMFPDHSAILNGLINRFEDLIEPFRLRGYYHPDFNGSFSIKSVLPAMFPDEATLNYKSLEIQNGQMAMDTFASLHRIESRDERSKIRKDLLEYCKLDTLAMVKIMDRLREVCDKDL